jgi:hypothetical protein
MVSNFSGDPYVGFSTALVVAFPADPFAGLPANVADICLPISLAAFRRLPRCRRRSG